MKTVFIHDLQPHLKQLLVSQLGIDTTSNDGVIIFEPIKRDFEYGTNKHFLHLLTHTPNQIGIMLCDLTLTHKFGTTEEEYDRNSHRNWDPNSQIRKVIEWLKKDHYYSTLANMFDDMPFDLIDDCLSGHFEEAESHRFTINLPFDIRGEFDLDQEVVEAYYNGQIAMFEMSLDAQVKLYSNDGTNANEGQPPFTWEVTNDDLRQWVDLDISIDSKAGGSNIHQFQYAMGIQKVGKGKKIMTIGNDDDNDD